jgi:hypothetical protein
MIETIDLKLLLATFAGWVGRRQSHVIAYLIEENGVLKEQLKSGGRRSGSPTTSVADWLPRGSHWAGRSCNRLR